MDDPSCKEGSIIECHNQILGEELRIPGTPFALRYQSERVPGAAGRRHLEIPLVDAKTPASVQSIELEVSIAGTKLTKSFRPSPDLRYGFDWDGRDAYGRMLQGPQTVTVRVGYTYSTLYRRTSKFGDVIGAGTAFAGVTRDGPRNQMTLWNQWTGFLGGWDATSFGLGGWSLTPLHAYESNTRTIQFGDGRRRTASELSLGCSALVNGGFGIYYQTLGNGGCGCTDGINGSFSQLSDGVNPAFNWDNGGVQPPGGFKNPPVLDPSFDNFNAATRMGPNFAKAPRIYNWSFTVEHEVKNFLIEAAYVGNRAHGLNSTVELNQLPVSNLSLGSLLVRNILDPAVVAAGYKEPFPGFAKGWGGGGTLAQALRPFPQYGNVSDYNAGVGKLWYDSLQTKVERRFGAWQLLASYVWSKNLDLMHFRQIFSQGGQVQAQDAYNIAAAKSYSPFDYPHVLNLLNSYQLPFGRGRKFMSSAGRVSNLIVGGWVISAAQQYRSSTLIQVQTPGNPLGAGQIFSRITNANITGNPIRTGVSRLDLDPNNPDVRWFNSGASSPFAVAAPYTLGNAALYYGSFRNPPVLSENISIVKNFAITETIRFQYRADAFNAFNRTDFGGVNGTIGTMNFGRPSGIQLGPRAITMGLSLEW